MGATVFFLVINIIKEITSEVINRRYTIKDDRDTDERRVAGEDTSEVAKKYLKSAFSDKMTSGPPERE
jgi:hypothetical protein